MNGNGFYKNNNGELWFGTKIEKTDIILTLENKNEFQLPFEDWYYFDSEEEARIFFNLPKIQEENI